MTCLDTNYLIRALIPESSEAMMLEHWLHSGEVLGIPAVAWYEFLCGSTEDEEMIALALLDGRIFPFTEAVAQTAANCFRSLNKPRWLRVDAMIACTAIHAQARLATNNHDDFTPFLAHGLELL